MIKCNVKACGLAKGQPSVRTAKDGTQFIAFTLCVIIKGKDGSGKSIDISVTTDYNDGDLSKYVDGTRLVVEGNLMVRKRDEAMFFNLRSTSINPTDAEDSIEGTVEFRGTVGKSVDERKDKKGHDYFNFSAYTTEKLGENYAFLWVNFVRFGAKKEDWLQPGIGVNAKGTLSITVYHERVGLNCRLTELSHWDKAQYLNSQVTQNDPTSAQPF